jgi:uncharacterized protein YcbX
MSAWLAQIWRHPIKGIGSEPLETVGLKPDAPLPGDRAWAVRHARAEARDGWLPRRNFLVVASGPNLARVTAQSRPDGRIALTHPDRPPLVIEPDRDEDALIAWIRPLWPDRQAAPARLVRAPAKGMADNGEAQISLLSLRSLRVLSQRLGHPLDPRRFRGNLWLDGLAPWEEFDLIGRTVAIGPVEIEITDRIERCRATEANPETGQRDANLLRLLEDGYGHRDFGVYGTVRSGGSLHRGNEVQL